MVYTMTHYPRTVTLQRKVYIGGGEAYDESDERTVAVYDMKSNEWSRLPEYQYKWFGMTVMNSSLTLVGGYDRKVTNQLAVFDPMTRDWTYPYPQMTTPRFRPAVSTYNVWLLVAGGYDYNDGGRDLATVELLNTSTNQWLTTSPLPTPYSCMTSAILREDWYLVTYSKQVFRVSLPDIVSQTVDQSTASKSPTLWCRLPETPLKCSAAIALRESLLVVGGGHDTHTPSTDIHLYQPESKKWTKVGDLLTARHYCSCILLSDGELLVAGGKESSGKRSSRVDVASVL